MHKINKNFNSKTGEDKIFHSNTFCPSNYSSTNIQLIPKLNKQNKCMFCFPFKICIILFPSLLYVRHLDVSTTCFTLKFLQDQINSIYSNLRKGKVTLESEMFFVHESNCYIL